MGTHPIFESDFDCLTENRLSVKMSVLLETTMGDLVIDLYTESRPRCCVNFLKLCKAKYYNYSMIHKVERDFCIQLGDPTDAQNGQNPKNGHSIFHQMHGEGARYFEAQTLPRILHDRPGLVSMINNGKDKFGSQFLITTGNADTLDEGQVVFGEVGEGLEDILAKINETFVDKSFRPLIDIRINHTIVLDDPFEDPEGMTVPSRSPSPDPKRLFGANTRIGADEIIDDEDDLDDAERKEREEILAAEHRANLLTIIGDLPDENAEPDKNVLFVCKLNPATTDEDLELIFSRFGDIKTCEIIRDKRTMASLQYAFIEFDTDEACERAYFKMDNVLIVDRRIHVDFSQSVAKQWRQWKRGGAMRTKEEIADKDFKKEFTESNSRNTANLERRNERRNEKQYGLVKSRKRSPQRRERSPDRSRDRRRSRSRDRKRRSRSRERRRSRDRRRSRSHDRKRSRR